MKFFKDNTTEIAQIIATSFKEVTTSYIEQLSKLEAEHWKQVEKQSGKQLQILEKQTKDFIGVMEKFIESQRPVVANKEVTELISKLPDRENTIAKEEMEEKELDDIDRVPIVNGMNLQFEGEEEIMPINIS